jgi:RNA polymerase sigma-70 factor (sigma-E family)
VKRDEEAGFEEFVAASGRRLLRTAYLLAGDRHHAEDLLQITLERTARRWTRISGAPEAYARTVLANLATDRWRRRSARPQEFFTDPPERGAGDPANDLVLRDALMSALRDLTRRQRAVLVLRFFDDLTEAETAAALGITTGTVKSTTSRSLDRLRAIAELHDLTQPDQLAGPRNLKELPS